MDVTGDDWPFLVLIIFGLIVIGFGIIYCLCRIFCYDFWNACCSRLSHRVMGPPGRSPSAEASAARREESFIKKIVLGKDKGGKNGKNGKGTAGSKDSWATVRETKGKKGFKGRQRRDSFAPDGYEEDEIIYHVDSGGAKRASFDRTDSRASFQLERDGKNGGTFQPVKKVVHGVGAGRKPSKGYY